MRPTLQELGIDRLSVEDRLALAQQIWDGVVAELEQQPLTKAQQDELERRVAAANTNPGEGILWEAVWTEARVRWQR